MAKKTPKERIDDILEKVYALLQEAVDIADDNEVTFEFQPNTLGTYTPRHIVWEASSGCEWETSDEWADARWSHEHFDWDASTC